MKNYVQITLVWILFLVAHSGLGQQPVQLSDESGWFEVSNKMLFLVDTSGTYSIADVSTGRYSEQFFKPQTSNGDLYPTELESVYWGRLAVSNASPENKKWLLEVMNFGTKDLSFYQKGPSGAFVEVGATGADRKFSDRNFDHKNFEFDLPVKAGDVAIYYIRFRPAGPSKMALRVKSYESFISYSLKEYYILGLFYGFIVVMILYNLILFFNLRVKTYLYYVLYVLCVGVGSIAQDGTGFQFLWPNFPGVTNFLSELALVGIIICTMSYSRSFLNTGENAPKVDRLLKIMTYVVLGTFVLVQVLGVQHLSLLIPVGALPFTIILVSSIQIYRKGFRPARFFIVGFSFYFVGFVIKIFAYFGLLVNNIFTYYAHNIGMLFEMILFSVAIADRFKTMKNDKEQALRERNEQLVKNEALKDKVNRELELKVKERTKEIESKNEELAQANEKLKRLTEEVNQMNLKLDLDNRQLQKDIKEVSRSRVMLRNVDFKEFSKVYTTERDCLVFLAELKWRNGYACKKCGNDKYSKGKNPLSRRCTKCNYDESATANTLFHRVKIPIQKAFFMVYLVNSRDGKITSDELSERLEIRRETCWSFKKKVTNAMDKVGKHKRDTETVEGWGQLALIIE